MLKEPEKAKMGQQHSWLFTNGLLLIRVSESAWAHNRTGHEQADFLNHAVYLLRHPSKLPLVQADERSEMPRSTLVSAE